MKTPRAAAPRPGLQLHRVQIADIEGADDVEPFLGHPARIGRLLLGREFLRQFLRNDGVSGHAQLPPVRLPCRNVERTAPHRPAASLRQAVSQWPGGEKYRNCLAASGPASAPLVSVWLPFANPSCRTARNRRAPDTRMRGRQSAPAQRRTMTARNDATSARRPLRSPITVYGDALDHEHGPDADHDHDAYESLGPLEENPIWIQDNVRADQRRHGYRLVRHAGDLFAPPHAAHQRGPDQPLHRGQARDAATSRRCSLTPYRSDTRIDDAALGRDHRRGLCRGRRAARGHRHRRGDPDRRGAAPRERRRHCPHPGRTGRRIRLRHRRPSHGGDAGRLRLRRGARLLRSRQAAAQHRHRRRHDQARHRRGRHGASHRARSISAAACR